ncbi:MAG: hypothetical protein JJ971_05455 [Balneolaceae bacterium]|nr:hypothetical protein [Balneolaceae bacterium]MBO6545823.1 hypothetical protein [Balneolaceae bacterium]MBO6647219.1 hypothetical protein [Balneolaceae bacterium]
MLQTVLIAITAFLLNIIFPWWSIAIPGLIFGYLFKKKAHVSFGWGFLAVFLLWGGQALYIHFANNGILSTRIAEMLGVGSPYLVILITGVLGGLVSGFATLTGTLFNKKVPS